MKLLKPIFFYWEISSLKGIHPYELKFMHMTDRNTKIHIPNVIFWWKCETGQKSRTCACVRGFVCFMTWTRLHMQYLNWKNLHTYTHTLSKLRVGMGCDSNNSSLRGIVLVKMWLKRFSLWHFVKFERTNRKWNSCFMYI